MELWGVVMGGACSSGAVMRENGDVRDNLKVKLKVTSRRTFSALTNLTYSDAHVDIFMMDKFSRISQVSLDP